MERLPEDLRSVIVLRYFGGFTLALAIQDWQIRDLNSRVRRLEAQENLRSLVEMMDSLKTRKKED